MTVCMLACMNNDIFNHTYMSCMRNVMLVWYIYTFSHMTHYIHAIGLLIKSFILKHVIYFSFLAGA